MANRYWVGNGGNWSDTAHWSTTSGGSGGASVPTSTDATNSSTIDLDYWGLYIDGADNTTVEIDFSGFGNVAGFGAFVYPGGGGVITRTYNLTTGGNSLPDIEASTNGAVIELQDDLTVLDNI